MIEGRVSIVLPSRNEQFLVRTVEDLLAKCRGDIEIIPVLDGYWPNPPLPEDPRVVPLHRGIAQGMRQGINAACRIASGEWLMKLDAHCSVAPGIDETLKAQCDRDWIVVPRRYPLDGETWAFETRADQKYPIDYHFLSYPYERPGDPNCGLHGDGWRSRREDRKHILLDEEMSSQGSCWFMHRDHWARLGEMDTVHYGPFYQEFQEIGCKTWLSGGKVMVNKATWYAHLRKGKKYGRGYSMEGFDRGPVTAYTADYWMQTTEFTHSLRWLVERFWPVPTWPADLDFAFTPRTYTNAAVVLPALSLTH